MKGNRTNWINLNILFLCCGLLIFAFSLSASAQESAPSSATIVRADQMLDVRSGRLISPAVLLIRDGIIEAINPTTIPNNIETINLENQTLLPGLIDMHTHITGDYFTGDDWTTAEVRQTAPDWALQGVKFAQEILGAGFTTVRDVGAQMGFPDVALMRAVNKGIVPGPDIWPAGHAISMTGGHCDSTGFAPGVLERGPESGIADGVDEVIKAVRYQAKHGVKTIKVCATGGIFSFSQNAEVGAQQYSLEELQAIVREAHKLGLKVAAHAHGTKGINVAVQAGVDSIEHGSILSKESIQLMKKNDTFLVPQAYINEFELEPDTPPATVAKNEYLKPLVIESFKLANDAGVKMAFGTDNGVFPHKDSALEFAVLVRYGATEIHALRMATIYAAELLGVDDRGEIEQGKRADLIAVPGNPLNNITVMESVSFVMKQGKVFKDL